MPAADQRDETARDARYPMSVPPFRSSLFIGYRAYARTREVANDCNKRTNAILDKRSQARTRECVQAKPRVSRK